MPHQDHKFKNPLFRKLTSSPLAGRLHPFFERFLQGKKRKSRRVSAMIGTVGIPRRRARVIGGGKLGG